jgi:hypothetical protein
VAKEEETKGSNARPAKLAQKENGQARARVRLALDRGSECVLCVRVHECVHAGCA